MAPDYRLLEYVSELPREGTEPIFIIDTSAIVDLEERDPVGLQAFLSKRNGDFLVTPSILRELRRQHTRCKNRRRLVQKETLERIESLVAANTPLINRISEHPGYDTHRYLGRTIAYETCCEKKRARDPFSTPDGHTLAFALTAATHADDLDIPNTYPVILTADEHLMCPIEHLANPFQPDHQAGYERIKIIRTRL